MKGDENAKYSHRFR